MIIPLKSLAILLCILFLWPACNVREEGCLDIRATNFAFDADRSCDDCCNYPNVILSLSHRWGDDRPFRKDSIFQSANNQEFRLVDLDYAFSAFDFIDSENETLQIEEETEIYCDNGGMVEQSIIPDDILIVDVNSIRYTIGTFRNDGLFTEGRFTIGLPENYSCAIADSVDLGQPLATNSVIFLEESASFGFGRLVIQKDTSNVILDTLYIPNLSELYTYELNQEFRTGRPDTVSFTIQYDKWFDEISVQSDANATIIDKLIQNIPGGIEFE